MHGLGPRFGIVSKRSFSINVCNFIQCYAVSLFTKPHLVSVTTENNYTLGNVSLRSLTIYYVIITTKPLQLADNM